MTAAHRVETTAESGPSQEEGEENEYGDGQDKKCELAEPWPQAKPLEIRPYILHPLASCDPKQRIFQDDPGGQCGHDGGHGQASYQDSIQQPQ